MAGGGSISRWLARVVLLTWVVGVVAVSVVVVRAQPVPTSADMSEDPFCAIWADRPRALVSDAPASGPMVVRGTLEGEPGDSPSGRSCAGWVSWFERGQPRSVDDPCVSLEVSHLFIVEGGARLAISPSFFVGQAYLSGPRPYLSLQLIDEHGSQFLETYVPRTTLLPSAAMILVDVGGTVVSPHAPPRFATCAQALTPPAVVGGPYVEACFPNGASVEVSGCRTGYSLKPCGDSLDAISLPGLTHTGKLRCIAWPPATPSAHAARLSAARFGSRALALVLGAVAGAWGVAVWREQRATSGRAPTMGPYRTPNERGTLTDGGGGPSPLLVFVALSTSALAVVVSALWR